MGRLLLNGVFDGTPENRVLLAALLRRYTMPDPALKALPGAEEVEQVRGLITVDRSSRRGLRLATYWEMLTIGPVMVPWPLRLRLPWPAAFGVQNVFGVFFQHFLAKARAARNVFWGFNTPKMHENLNF